MKSTFVLHNGKLTRRSELVFPLEHRYLRFADGFFETMRAFAIHVPLFSLHFQRMKKAFDLLLLNNEQFPDEETLLFDIQRLIKSNKHFGSSRIRITVYRAGEGLYATNEHAIEWFVESFPIDNTTFVLNTKGLHISVYEHLTKPMSPLNSIKFNHPTVNILAANWARQRRLDDAILINERHHLVEATSSNLFVVKDKIIYTPPTDDGGVDGIMRRYLLTSVLMELGMQVIDKSFKKDLLDTADEIFLTNAVQGCLWVVGYHQRRFYNDIAKQLIQELNNRLLYEHH